MAEQIPVAYAVNLLEASTVTATGTATGFPVGRLSDRDIGLAWKDDATTGTRTLSVDQGASGTQAVDTWILAGGHNLNGVALSVDSSDDTISWTTQDSVTPASTVALRRSLTLTVARYWRLQIASPSVAPQIAEWFLTLAVPLPKGPHPQAVRDGTKPNVIVNESIGGHEWLNRRGAIRWMASWQFALLTDSQWTTLLGLQTDVEDGAAPFWLEDLDGTLRWVRWANAPLLAQAVQAQDGRRTVTMDLQEVL